MPWFRPRRAPAKALDPHIWRQSAAGLPWLRALDDARTQRLLALVTAFLDGKTITPLHGLHLNDVHRIRLATLCCLPLLEFGHEGLHGWSQLLVYPDAFRVQRSHMDSHGVLHEGAEDLIGEAWEHGPVILSWADVRADIASPREGYCVVAHEIAHKLDALDGALDGTPPLPHAWQREWAREFQDAFDALQAEVDAGGETEIDPYAAESPEEFFAVCSELHFSDAATLRDAMPVVASHLERFYGPALLD